MLAKVSEHLQTHLGADPVRASVTFLGVASMQVLRFAPDADGLVHYATLGCARAPMGDPDAVVADPVRGPRAELVLTVRRPVDGVLRSLAVLASSPAVEGVVLQSDSLLDLSEPLWEHAPFTAVLLGVSSVPELGLESPMDAVALLSVTPVTATEAAWVRLRGADALRQAWAEAGVDVSDPDRSAVTL
ncbi:MAG: suppressor of fused domain protein [Mycobacteriaceae bacterium]